MTVQRQGRAIGKDDGQALVGTPTAGMFGHPARGSQYVSELYQILLKENGFVCSMSREDTVVEVHPVLVGPAKFSPLGVEFF